MPTRDTPPDDEQTSLKRAFEPPAREVSLSLRVIEGPDAGREFPVDAGAPQPALLGQSPVCAILLRDPAVSRRHAALQAEGGLVHLRDLGSSNGTTIDGVRVIEAHARVGQTIRVGNSALAVQSHEGAPPASPLAPSVAFGRVLGGSTAIRRLYPLFEKLAGARVPLLIEGETGTGKEALAEALHEQGPRPGAPFVVFDCTTVSAGLMESALFGHERGAFTGATSAQRGVFEQAEGGTLLIDEVGDLDLSLQPKLLRAIDRGEVRRVGGAASIRVNVRLMAATRRDLDDAVQRGSFRDDLFHRLAVARVELPPLRARKGDVRLLAEAFVREFGGAPGALGPELLARWEGAPWPGNVRELRNAVARRLALGDLADLESSEPPAPGGALASSAAPAAADGFLESVLEQDLPFPRARQAVLSEFENRYLLRVLARHNGNVARSAAASGVARRYFQVIRARLRAR